MIAHDYWQELSNPAIIVLLNSTMHDLDLDITYVGWMMWEECACS